MATYSTEKGFTIQSLASDPYASEVLAGTWASANAMNTGRAQAAAAGTQTAASIFGGSPALTATEKYDGTNWTTSPATLNTGRKEFGGVGTQDAALAFGGAATITATEVFNGTAWTTSPGTLNTGRRNMSSFGTSTAAVTAEGHSPPNVANVEEWNGSTWSEETNTPQTNGQGAGCGIITAGLIFGGYTTTANAASFTYDGTSWAAVGVMNTARWNLVGFGTQSAGMAVGGGDPTPVIGGYTENYNGSVWTEVADTATKRENGSGVGTSTLGLVMGGPGDITTTEEFAVPSTASIAQEGQVWYNTTSNVLKGFAAGATTGAWSSGTAMSTARQAGAASTQGTITASIVFCGNSYPPGTFIVANESYNGTAWSEEADLSTGRYSLGSAGTPTAALGFAGYTPSRTNANESYNGTSWTTVNSLNSGRAGPGSNGTQTSAICAGGYVPPTSAICETWDGTSWAEVGNLTTARYVMATAGDASAALNFGGDTWPGAVRAEDKTEKWDGTSWTEVANLNSARVGNNGSGVQTAALCIGGGQLGPPLGTAIALTEYWDGTSWTEVADLATARREGAAAGSSVGSLMLGNTPLPIASKSETEEWTGGTAIKTFTSS